MLCFCLAALPSFYSDKNTLLCWNLTIYPCCRHRVVWLWFVFSSSNWLSCASSIWSALIDSFGISSPICCWADTKSLGPHKTSTLRFSSYFYFGSFLNHDFLRPPELFIFLIFLFIYLFVIYCATKKYKIKIMDHNSSIQN